MKPDDALVDVGDEALVCARALADVSPSTARVVVANCRQSAVDWAVSRAPRVDVLVIDGPLQITPVRATLSLLAVDALSPWGTGQVLPAGDLRAPIRSLLAAADAIVPVDALPHVVTVEGEAHELRSFIRFQPGKRLGLFSAIARPKRLVSALLEVGLTPDVRLEAPDHGPLTRAISTRIRAARVDLWLATPKCALHLEPLGVKVGVLDGRVQLSEAIRERLRTSWDNAVHSPP